MGKSKPKPESKASTADIVKVMQRILIEGEYPACGYVRDPWLLSQLAGADFEAGDAAAEAYDAGVHPREIVGFFISEQRKLADDWQVLIEVAPNENERRERALECVAGVEAVGLARGILAGDLTFNPAARVVDDALTDVITMRLDDKSVAPVIYAGWALADWAVEVLSGEQFSNASGKRQCMEACTRAQVRIMSLVAGRSHCDVEDDEAALAAKYAARLLKNFREHLAKQAKVKVSA